MSSDSSSVDRKFRAADPAKGSGENDQYTKNNYGARVRKSRRGHAEPETPQEVNAGESEAYNEAGAAAQEHPQYREGSTDPDT